MVTEEQCYGPRWLRDNDDDIQKLTKDNHQHWLIWHRTVTTRDVLWSSLLTHSLEEEEEEGVVLVSQKTTIITVIVERFFVNCRIEHSFIQQLKKTLWCCWFGACHSACILSGSFGPVGCHWCCKPSEGRTAWTSGYEHYRVGQLKWSQLTLLLVAFECVDKIQWFFGKCKLHTPRSGVMQILSKLCHNKCLTC